LLQVGFIANLRSVRSHTIVEQVSYDYKTAAATAAVPCILAAAHNTLCIETPSAPAASVATAVVSPFTMWGNGKYLLHRIVRKEGLACSAAESWQTAMCTAAAICGCNHHNSLAVAAFHVSVLEARQQWTLEHLACVWHIKIRTIRTPSCLRSATLMQQLQPVTCSALPCTWHHSCGCIGVCFAVACSCVVQQMLCLAHDVFDDVSQALRALGCMEHRGACSADDDSGDGAGLMTQIPWKLLKKEMPSINEATTG
jgi:hypothetical protein